MKNTAKNTVRIILHHTRLTGTVGWFIAFGGPASDEIFAAVGTRTLPTDFPAGARRADVVDMLGANWPAFAIEPGIGSVEVSK